MREFSKVFILFHRIKKQFFPFVAQASFSEVNKKNLVRSPWIRIPMSNNDIITLYVIMQNIDTARELLAIPCYWDPAFCGVIHNARSKKMDRGYPWGHETA